MRIINNRNLTIRTRLGLLLGLGVAATAIAGIISFYITREMSRLGRDVGLYEAHWLATIMQIKVEATQGHLWFEELVSGDTSNSFTRILKHWGDGIVLARSFDQGIVENGTVRIPPNADPEIRKQAAEIADQFELFARVARERLQRGAGTGSELDEQFDAIYEGIISRSEVIESAIRTGMRMEQDKMARLHRLSIWLMIGIFSGSSLALLLVGVALIRSITRPVDHIVAGMQSIVERNDFTEKLTIATDDELGRIGEWMNSLTQKLALVIDGARKSSRQLVRAARSLELTTENFSETTNNQAASFEESAASVEELNASTENVARLVGRQTHSIEAIYEQIRAAAAEFQNIGVSLRKLVELAAEAGARTGIVKSAMHSAAQSMTEVSDHSHRIAQMVSLITEISDRVNLLALNASIEAARAGTAGRGFAVVAEEVSRLADRTAAAVGEIQALVGDTQGTVRNGVTAVATASASLADLTTDVAHVERAVTSATESMWSQSARVDSIKESAGQIMQVAKQIETNTTEQKLALAEIGSSVQNISESTQTMGVGISELLGMARGFRGEAEDLSATVKDFILPGLQIVNSEAETRTSPGGTPYEGQTLSLNQY